MAKQKNWQAYNRLLSQDFIWIDDSGVLLGRELFLKYIADLDLIDYTMGSVKVTTLNNNTAMLTYKVILRKKSEVKPARQRPPISVRNTFGVAVIG